MNTAAHRGRRKYREHGRSVVDVELYHPTTGATVIVEIREGGSTYVHDSRDNGMRASSDPEGEIAAYKAAGYVEYES